MTDTLTAAKALRDKLCIQTECTFDDNCACLAAITEALTIRAATVDVQDADIESLDTAKFRLAELRRDLKFAQDAALALLRERARDPWGG